MSKTQRTMTKREIIEETARFYTENPKKRAIESGGCMYQTTDGRQCAVGRCLINEEAENLVDYVGPVWALSGGRMHGIDGMLQPKYRGHELMFWEELQEFHDTHGYWFKSGGLTTYGVDVLFHLLNNWSDK